VKRWAIRVVCLVALLASLVLMSAGYGAGACPEFVSGVLIGMCAVLFVGTSEGIMKNKSNQVEFRIKGQTGQIDGYVEMILGVFAFGLLIKQKLSKRTLPGGTTEIYIDAELRAAPLGNLGDTDIPERPADDPRAAVLEAYSDLDDTITDYYDDFLEDKLTWIYQRWIAYVAACIEAKEGYFALQDIHSDDMAAIPPGYPQEKPDLPVLSSEKVGSMYDTPRARMIHKLLGGK